MQQLTQCDSVTVHASTARVYEVVSDISRTGQWSPTCVRCEWDDPDQTGVGGNFTGYNETPERAWQTTSTVIAADPGRRFAEKSTEVVENRTQAAKDDIPSTLAAIKAIAEWP